MNVLNPKLRYVPAVATDVATTWQRFGFDPRSNQERRNRLKWHGAKPAQDGSPARDRLRLIEKSLQESPGVAG